MDILFKNDKIEALCNDSREAARLLGSRQAKRQRLDEMRAATCLADVGRLPAPRCHELVGDRKGQLSVDLVDPYRLIFEPADSPPPRKADGGLDWSNVAAVRILAMEDTHE